MSRRELYSLLLVESFQARALLWFSEELLKSRMAKHDT